MVTSSNDNVNASRTIASGGMLVLLAAVGFSAKAVLVKLAYASSPHLDAITLMGLRMLLSLPFFLAVALWSRRGGEQSQLSRRELATAAGLGILGFYVAGLLDFAGLSYIPAGLERLILFLYPTLYLTQADGKPYAMAQYMDLSSKAYTDKLIEAKEAHRQEVKTQEAAN